MKISISLGLVLIRFLSSCRPHETNNLGPVNKGLQCANIHIGGIPIEIYHWIVNCILIDLFSLMKNVKNRGEIFFGSTYF
jgi:hypothetical protein